MVTFVLDNRTETKVVYKYHPEKHVTNKSGIISFDIEKEEFTLDVVAEEDFICRTSAEELNEMRDAINKMRLENGQLPLTEEELPTATEGEEWYYYADHVVRRLREEFANDNIPEKGTIAWY